MWDRNTQEGNILISTILILLVMNLLGLGLMNGTVKDMNVSAYKAIQSEVFHATESCAQDMFTYLEAQTAPVTDDYTITENDLSFMYTGQESAGELLKLAGYSYACTLSELTIKAETATDDGSGDALGDGDGYSSDSDLSPKYYYQIVSTGAGPRNTTKTITTIVSVEF